MRALLDTNIIIHRETEKPVNLSIGTLFRWLDKAGYEKCIHPIVHYEFQKYQDKEKLNSLNIKLDSYIELKTVAPLASEVQSISEDFDKNENDQNDSVLLNEVFQERVDLLVSEDKKIHEKAEWLGVQDKVFSIDGFLEKVVSENPDFINYNVLSVSKKYFGEIDLSDQFFESFRKDYQEFNRWFNKKSDEACYVTLNKGKILSFLYLKVETESENYADIFPIFARKRRLKIGTFKVVSNGVRLGERFLKIIFDNAIQSKVEEIYITIFNNSEDQQRLIDLLKDWGFDEHGTKKSHNGEELVLVRDFSPRYFPENPRHSFPYFSLEGSIYLCPIYPHIIRNYFQIRF
ncbi:MAG: PIN domain-containing protein [Rhodobacteraceae bacterium]|nr:PIN domain-containing protein [Paracoccaceae bacterium]